MLSPITFFRQVRQEVSKITWPTRKEANLSFVMVAVFVSIATLFFLLVDTLVATGIKFIVSQ